VGDDYESVRAALEGGEEASAEQLFPLVYEELRRVAHRHMRGEARGNSLHTTGLVHETYMRLVKPGSQGESQWKGKEHFLAAASQAMRRILVDRARARGALKRGGDRQRLDFLDVVHLSFDDVPPELVELDEALTQLAQEAPEMAKLVSLRFFSGLTLKEVAAAMCISTNTADRHWAFARAWLLAAMEDNR
jgi:RNA polymerase sigma factor (TIGR02999 family)